MSRHTTSLLVSAVLAFFLLGCQAQPEPARYGMVIGVKPEKIAYYKELHAKPWPTVMKTIDDCNIKNFSIWMRELEPGKYYLFGYFEYTGKNLDADMKKMAADPETQRWWKETDPCQYPIATAKSGDKWTMMVHVFQQP